MNEREYIILEILFILIAVLYPIIGYFILSIFNLNTLVSVLLLILVFIVFYSLSIYCRFKRYRFISEMLNEIKKYVKDYNDDK